MGLKCITIYDVTGIQNFVFSSNKAKENIGASIYIQKLFDEILMEMLPENSLKDWKNSNEFKILNDNSIPAEVVYIGGGNAMIVFDSKETAINTTKKLSKRLLDDTRLTLGVAVSYLETGFVNFSEDMKALRKELDKNKNSFIRSFPLNGIAITKECADGLPTSGKKDKNNIYISDVAYFKQQQEEKKSFFNFLLPDNYVFPENFDDLGRYEGESHIAVVHIDGNSMGNFIDKKISNIEDYAEAVSTMREISKNLEIMYKEVFKDLIKECIKSLNDEVKKYFNLKKCHLPIRPIILSGDDVTFVCDGRIGIQLAIRFLQILSNKELNINNEVEKLSACAGVAIVKSHFPFYRAYSMAESLCQSAKTKAKLLCNSNDIGNWFDYHITYSGFQTNLDKMRRLLYNVPDMGKVTRDVEFKQYNLLLRPFCVNGKSDPYYKWEQMEKVFLKMKKFPRSRLKALRNAFKVSEKAVKLKQIQNKSRGYSLPEFEMRDEQFLNDENIFFENQTAYFEPLELLDFYIPELNLSNGGTSNDN